MLAADKLRNDPRIAEAKRLLLGALSEHQQTLEVRGPSSKDPFVARAENARGLPLFFPYIGSGIGNGPLVELADGSVKYDFINGIGAHFGHSLPDLIEAGISAALDDTVMQGNLQQGREQVLLMERLIGLSGFKHCFITTSGAMACENALKIAFQKRSPRKKILAFRHCFMGRTCLLANITDKPAYREGIPPIIAVDYVPFGPEGVEVLKKHLESDDYIAMAFELIQGEGGFNVGSREWLLPMMEMLKEKGVLVIVDEVQTFGRTTRPFAFQHFELNPDIVTIGKMTQMCATLFNDPPKPGLLSQTFTASTSAIYAAIAILDRLEKDHFGPDGKNAKIHAHFVQHLKRIKTLSEPYGCGLMVAATPYDGSKEKALGAVRALYDAGLMSFIAGQEPTRLRFLVPGSATFDDIDKVAAIMEKTLC